MSRWSGLAGGESRVQRRCFDLLLIKLPRSKLTGYQNTEMRIYPKGVTPECFNRGSSSGVAWIPDRSIRE